MKNIYISAIILIYEKDVLMNSKYQGLLNGGFAANKGTGWINAMLICNDLPELGTNLVSALALPP